MLYRKCKKCKGISTITNISKNYKNFVKQIKPSVFYWVLLFFYLSFQYLLLVLTAYAYCQYCPFSRQWMAPSKLDQLHYNSIHLLKSHPEVTISRQNISVPIHGTYSALFLSFGNLLILVLRCCILLCLLPTGGNCLANKARLSLFLSYKYCVYFIIELDSFIYYEVSRCKFWGFGICKMVQVGCKYTMIAGMLGIK